MAEERHPPRAQRAFEPVARSLAGRRGFPLWAVVHHRGRSSGTEYVTPIAVVPTVDTSLILIGLPWGLKTNWARNVVAAGGATVRWKGRDVRTARPRIVDAGEATRLAKPFFRFVIRRMPGAIILEREDAAGTPPSTAH
jgi:deazaflavin-dependent oxidoreductase (nitroreductase family)